MKARLDLAGDVLDRPVRLPRQLARVTLELLRRRGGRETRPADFLANLDAQAPHAGKKAADAANSLVGPIGVLVRRAEEQDVAARGIRAVIARRT